MAAGLFTTDPLVAQNFFLEIDGKVISSLISVSGLDIEIGSLKATQVGADGLQQQIKSLGQRVEAPDLQLTRVAPVSMENDALWKWFNEIRAGGLSVGDRASKRKNGSVVLYDTTHTEAARFNFFSAWPTKISTDQLSVDSAEAIKETITLVIERLERVK